MNPLAHIFITYSAAGMIFEEAGRYVLLIAALAVIVDLDHMPGIFTYPRQKRRDYATQVAHFRSILQEPVGVMLAGMLLLYALRGEIAAIAAFCLLMHWLIDFLTVHTRPLYPFSDKLVCLFFKTKKAKIISDIAITALSGAVFAIFR